jgi:hypothetical protein
MRVDGLLKRLGSLSKRDSMTVLDLLKHPPRHAALSRRAATADQTLLRSSSGRRCRSIGLTNARLRRTSAQSVSKICSTVRPQSSCAAVLAAADRYRIGARDQVVRRVWGGTPCRRVAGSGAGVMCRLRPQFEIDDRDHPAETSNRTVAGYTQPCTE